MQEYFFMEVIVDYCSGATYEKENLVAAAGYSVRHLRVFCFSTLMFI